MFKTLARLGCGLLALLLAPTPALPGAGRPDTGRQAVIVVAVADRGSADRLWRQARRAVRDALAGEVESMAFERTFFGRGPDGGLVICGLALVKSGSEREDPRALRFISRGTPGSTVFQGKNPDFASLWRAQCE